jgi:hypothetical protein
MHNKGPSTVRSRRRWWAGLASGVLTLATACVARQDELDCADAVGRLQACCPGLSGSTLSCAYTSDDGFSSLPDLSTDQSACIRHESCGELRASGVCARAMAIGPNSGPATYASMPAYAVCP